MDKERKTGGSDSRAPAAGAGSCLESARPSGPISCVAVWLYHGSCSHLCEVLSLVCILTTVGSSSFLFGKEPNIESLRAGLFNSDSTALAVSRAFRRPQYPGQSFSIFK